MNTARDENLGTEAAEYVLGTLDDDERAAFEQRLEADTRLRADLAIWQRHFNALTDPIEEIEPGKDLFDAIEAAIEADRTPGFEDKLIVVRQNEGDWKPFCPGITKKTLFVNSEDGAETFLLRMEAGALLPAHDHAATEECLVLEGDITMGRSRYTAGDFQVVPANIAHVPIISETGALLFIRGELR